MTWQDTRLNAAEEAQALRKAGINPDCTQWTATDCERAEKAFATATRQKVEGETTMPKRRLYTATIRVLFDADILKESTACDAMSGLLSEPGNGILDWGYTQQPTLTTIKEPYSEGDFLREPPE